MIKLIQSKVNYSLLFLLIQMSTHLQKELSSKVEKLSKEVEAKDRELAVKNLALVDARKQENIVRQKLLEIKQTIGNTQNKTMKLIQQRWKLRSSYS